MPYRISSYLLTMFLFIRIDGRKYSSLRVFPQSFRFIFLSDVSSLLIVFQYLTKPSSSGMSVSVSFILVPLSVSFFCPSFSRDRTTEIVSNSINQVRIFHPYRGVLTSNSSKASILSSILCIGLTCFICCCSFAQFSDISVPKYALYNLT